MGNNLKDIRRSQKFISGAVFSSFFSSSDEETIFFSKKKKDFSTDFFSKTQC